MSRDSEDDLAGLRIPGGFPEDLYWHDDGYVAVDVELEGSMPQRPDSSGLNSRQPQASSSTRQSAPASATWPFFSLRKKPPQSKPRSDSKDAQASVAPDELVIAVFGMTGTGKSSFIQKLTGQEVGVGHGLRSCTSEIEEVKFKLGGVNVKLIDTPGFDDTTRSDTEILGLIASWMKDAYEEHKKLTGVIYLHRIIDTRMTGASVKNLRMLRSLCGTENLAHVTLATTMWDKVATEEGNAREQELLSDDDFWSRLKDDGARVRRYDNTEGSAMVLVNELLQMQPVLLQIQKEVAIEKKTPVQTDAGRSIQEELSKVTKQYKEDLAEIRQELDETKKERDLKYQKELLFEREKLEAKLKQATADAKLLKAPVNRKSWFTRSWKCVRCKARLTKQRDEHYGEVEGKCPGCHKLQKFV